MDDITRQDILDAVRAFKTVEGDNRSLSHHIARAGCSLAERILEILQETGSEKTSTIINGGSKGPVLSGKFQGPVNIK